MKLIWSKLATADLRALRRYSVERWGKAVATRYETDVRNAAMGAAARTERIKPLRDGLSMVRVRSHYLVVEIDPAADRLTVTRVLHVAMDVERHVTKSKIT